MFDKATYTNNASYRSDQNQVDDNLSAVLKFRNSSVGVRGNPHASTSAMIGFVRSAVCKRFRFRAEGLVFGSEGQSRISYRFELWCLLLIGLFLPSTSSTPTSTLPYQNLNYLSPDTFYQIFSVTTPTITSYTPTKAQAQGAIRRSQLSPEKKSSIYNSIDISSINTSPVERGAEANFGSPAPKKSHLRAVSSISTTSPVTIQKEVSKGKYIDLPFCLVDQFGHYAKDLTEGQMAQLVTLFDGVEAVGLYPPFLIFRVKKLPPKPWPLTVAGMPVYITTDDEDSAIDRGIGGAAKANILSEINLTKFRFQNFMLEKALNHFLDDLNLPIASMSFFGAFFRMEIPDHYPVDQLPNYLYHLPCFYLYKSQAPELLELSKRLICPLGTVWDDSRYDTPGSSMRPGVMIGSKGSTVTSGVLVKDYQGNRYMTIPTQILKGDESREIYHPRFPQMNAPIGVARITLEEVDISLVQLAPKVDFVNETFQGVINTSHEHIPAKVISGLRYENLLHTNVSMNNPFMGHCEGVLYGVDLKLEVLGGLRKLVKYHWSIFENGDSPVAGCCDSAILDENDDLVGFFRHVVIDANRQNTNFALTASSEILEKRGYEIVCT